MNEIDPWMSLPLWVLYGIQNQIFLQTWSWNPMREKDTSLTWRSSWRGSRSTNWDWTLQKCTFGVTTRKLLGFLVSDRWIEVDSSKIKAILEMPSPKSEKEIRGFLGRLQYISRFKLTSTYEPIFKLLRKNEPHEWNDECWKAFELIKEYILHPPILVPPMHGKPLLLYLFIIEDAVGSMLA